MLKTFLFVLETTLYSVDFHNVDTMTESRMLCESESIVNRFKIQSLRKYFGMMF